MRRHLFKGSGFSLVLRTLLLFFLSGAFLMFLLSGVIMSVIKARYIRETEEKSRKFIEQSYSIAEILIEPLYSRLYQIYSRDEVLLPFMYGGDFSGADYAALYARMRDIVKSSDLIRSLYVYNPARDVFFYFFSGSGASGMVTREAMFDTAALGMVESAAPKPVFTPRHARFAVQYDVFTVDENWISVFYGLSRGASTPALILNIDQARLQQFVESPIFDEGQETLIIDRNGIVISSANAALVNRDLSGEGIYRAVLDSRAQSGAFSRREGRAEHLVSFKKSPSLGWAFIGIGDKRALLAQFNRMQALMSTLTVVFMLSSLAVSFFVTRRVYTPLYRLSQTVLAAKPRRELGLSTKVYDELEEDYRALTEHVRTLEAEIERFTGKKARLHADTETKKTEWVRFTASHIDAHFADPGLSVELLADKIGISPNYLRTLFKAEKGVSISKYILDTRLERVKQLLRETKLRAHDIAAQAGFVNIKHFFVIFKQQTGTTVEAFRKQKGG
ncbi:MAG: AraC family transcriptional regulator [Treponema sp.]|jgi:AraC-like DNA-binding protein|nr:AraC family transcriptional regulator [Treponema sp.]